MACKDMTAETIAGMRAFVFESRQAVWKAYALIKSEKSGETDKTTSWLYDAACLLEILENDEGLLRVFSGYYANRRTLPWNKTT